MLDACAPGSAGFGISLLILNPVCTPTWHDESYRQARTSNHAGPICSQSRNVQTATPTLHTACIFAVAFLWKHVTLAGAGGTRPPTPSRKSNLTLLASLNTFLIRAQRQGTEKGQGTQNCRLISSTGGCDGAVFLRNPSWFPLCYRY